MDLNTTYNTPDAWNQLQIANSQRVEVDLDEVERVLDLARRTPGLANYESQLQRLSAFFRSATLELQRHDPRQLAGLIAFWEKYRSAVVQRYTGITPVELRAADRVVANIFDRFIRQVPPEHVAYARDATPLVYGGKGGLRAYFTHPPSLDRPFAIINLPHAAFDNVWQWLALPHETGHDLYATVHNLASEVEQELADRMRTAVQDGEITIPTVDLDLSVLDVPYAIQYSGEEFLATVWRAWANEAQADIVGLLNCGGAAIAALQQTIGFETDDTWDLFLKPDGTIGDEPEEHHTSYVRNALNIEALRRLGGTENRAFADELDQRFNALRPTATNITWRLGRSFVVAEVPAAEMLKSAAIAADVLLNHAFTALGNQSYSQIASFTDADQTIINAMVQPLLDGDPLFAAPGEPRHALAATMLAFDRDATAGDTINRTFKHFS